MNLPPRTASLGATVAAGLASAVAYPFLPSRVPTHFDTEGRADRYGSRTRATVLMPVVMLGIQVFNDRLGAWPGGGDREDRGSSVRALDEAVALTELGLLSAHVAVLANGAGLPMDMSRVNRGVYGVLLAALGNVLPKLPRNGLIGIRTPWTLADPRVWERTHRLGGYLLTAAGLLSLASLPSTGRRASRLPTAASLCAVGVSVAYSFVLYRRRARLGRS
jgi:uncharacterized membrane protein